MLITADWVSNMNASIDLNEIAAAWARLRESSQFGPFEVRMTTMTVSPSECVNRQSSGRRKPSIGKSFGDCRRPRRELRSIHHQIPESNPSDVLLFLMEQHGLKQSDLPEIGSQA